MEPVDYRRRYGSIKASEARNPRETEMTTITKATPTKLRNGDWGARVNSDSVREGDTIEITTKGGKSWTATVSNVIWTGDGVAIVTTESKNRSGYTPAKRDARGYVVERGHYEGYCGYPCPVSGHKCCPANGPCHDCM